MSKWLQREGRYFTAFKKKKSSKPEFKPSRMLLLQKHPKLTPQLYGVRETHVMAGRWTREKRPQGITVKTKLRFRECFTYVGFETKTRVVPFFKIGLRSAILLKRSRLELSIDVAELGSMLKNYQNTPYSRLVSYPKQVLHSPKQGFSFYCNS